MTQNTNETMSRFAALPVEYQSAVEACMQLLLGETPDNPLAILTLNRHMTQMQREGQEITTRIMPMLAGLALNIIDGVADREDRHILKSYFWRAEDVHKAKVPEILERTGMSSRA